MSPTLLTVSYLAATILFVLSLGGLSSPETSRRGNLYGMIGMAIAVLATVLGPQVTRPGYAWLAGALAARVGGDVGLGPRGPPQGAGPAGDAAGLCLDRRRAGGGRGHRRVRRAHGEDD